jgi:hypothetical protein
MEATALSSKTEVHAERFEDEQLNLSRNQYGPKEIAWSVVVYWATDDGETRRETSQTVATGLTSKESWVLMQAINAVRERWIGATRQPLRCGCELADKGGIHVIERYRLTHASWGPIARHTLATPVTSGKAGIGAMTLCKRRVPNPTIGNSGAIGFYRDVQATCKQCRRLEAKGVHVVGCGEVA